MHVLKVEKLEFDYHRHLERSRVEILSSALLQPIVNIDRTFKTTKTHMEQRQQMNRKEA